MAQMLLLAVGFVVLVVISAASIVLVDRARDDGALVVHTIEVENQLAAVLLDLRSAESAARGFLLSGETQFLSQYDSTISKVRQNLTKLGELTIDNPVQISNNATLAQLVDQRLDQLREIVARAKSMTAPAPSP